MSKIYISSETPNRLNSLLLKQNRREFQPLTPSKTINSKITRVTNQNIHEKHNRSISFFYSPNSNNKKTTFVTRPQKKKSRIKASYLKEHHLLAGEYASNTTSLKERYAKLKAKNNAALQAAKKQRKKRYKHKRDWTDRFALK